MANIPVERTTSSFPWWLLILGALVLGLILWLVLRPATDDRARDTTTVTQTEETTQTPAVTEVPDQDRTQTRDVITAPARLVDTPDGRQLVGREVRFADMRVDVAYSDSVFYATHVDGPPGRRFFVVVGNPAPAPSPFSPPATLNIGDVVTVEGTIDEPQRDALQRWEIAEGERDRLMRLEDYYVSARQVTR